MLAKSALNFALLLILGSLAGCGSPGEEATQTAAATPALSAPATMTPAPSATVEPPTPTAASMVESPTPTASVTATPVPIEILDYREAGSWGGQVIPQYPDDVALTEDGRLVVIDSGLKEVQTFTPAGELIDRWPIAGEILEGEFALNPPKLVAVGNASIYVVLAVEERIQRYAHDGTLLAEYSIGTSSSLFVDLVIGPDSRLYAVAGEDRGVPVFDGFQYGVAIFSPELELQETWDTPLGYAPTALSFDANGIAHLLIQGPWHSEQGLVSAGRKNSIARVDPAHYSPEVWEQRIVLELKDALDGLIVDARGRYLIAAEFNGDARSAETTTIHVADADGTVVDAWTFPDHHSIGAASSGLALDDNGDLYLADPRGNRVLKLNGEGNIEAKIHHRRQGAFADPTAITVAPDGTIYVVDLVLRSVQAFRPDGEFVASYGVSISLPFGPSNSNPDLTVDAAGSIYLVYDDAVPLTKRLLRIDPDGSEVDLAPVAPFFSPSAVVAEPDGTLSVLMSTSRAVRRYSTAGEPLEDWVHDVPDSGFTQDIARGPDGLYVINGVNMFGDGRPYWTLQRIEDSGKPLAIFENFESLEKYSDDATPSPGAIDLTVWDFAIGPDGAAFILDGGSGEVVRVSPDGRELGRWDVGLDGQRKIERIAVDATGRMYLTDSLNRQVVVYEPIRQ